MNAELEHKVSTAGRVSGWIAGNQQGDIFVQLYDLDLPTTQTRGGHNPDQYLGYCMVRNWDEGADLLERVKWNRRRPTRGGYVRTHARGPVPTGTRERVLAQTRTPGRKSSDRVVRAVLDRSKGRSEYSGELVTWFKRNGEPGLTVHHVWRNLDGTEVCLAILFEEHARLNYSTDGDMMNERMKDILCERFGLDKAEMDEQDRIAGEAARAA